MEKNCFNCKHGFDATHDGNQYDDIDWSEGFHGPKEYIQGCHKGQLPAMGYGCHNTTIDGKKMKEYWELKGYFFACPNCKRVVTHNDLRDHYYCFCGLQWKSTENLIKIKEKQISNVRTKSKK